VTADTDPVRVAPLMDEIERGVRDRLRRRLVERGITAYEDAEIFDRVRAVLQRGAERATALGAPDAGAGPDSGNAALLLPALVGDDVAWGLETHLRWSSHRPLVGNLIVAAKRRIVLPLTRWLFEYSQRNFRRQQQINRVLLACIEELAIENARLRRDLSPRRPSE
jgi:hypothetical protein